MKIWKKLKYHEENYSISSEGDIYSHFYNRLLTPNISHDGYKYYSLKNNKGVVKSKKIHRLLAEHFIPNPENKPTVNHIDENKLNNSLNNLEWMTHKEQINHGTRTSRMINTRETSKKYLNGRKRAAKKLNIPIIGIHVESGSSVRFDSIKEAGEKGFTRSSITNCILKKRQVKTHKGYKWYKQSSMTERCFDGS